MTKKRGRISLKQALKTRGLTDWERLSKLTDEEIRRAVANDPDTVIPTEEELAEFRLVNPEAAAEANNEDAKEP
jgi:hypothetical protein